MPLHPQNPEDGAEIIRGLFREGDIITLSGWWGIGKTPLLKDWALHVASGRDWCGFPTLQRPVVMIDFESKGSSFRRAWARMSENMSISPPTNVDPYVFNDRSRPPNTVELVAVCRASPGLDNKNRISWLREKLADKPDALLIIDPSDSLLPLDKNKGHKVGRLISDFRLLSYDYPQAAFMLVFNLRKTDHHSDMPDLFVNPRSWLQGTAGSLDIQNRSDSRLGLDNWKEQDDLLVLNGIRRDEQMEPLVIEPRWGASQEKGHESGFRVVDTSALPPEKIFKGRLLEGWEAMPPSFSIEDLKKVVSVGTAYRIRDRALAFGLIREEEGVFVKVIS